MTTTVVKTKSGPVRGVSKQTEFGKNYHSFQHIPYVQQPKGDLRFRDPKPVKPWTETLDCTKEGSPAYSFDFFLPDGPKIVGSDDCLGVNVFTPNLHPSKPLPVFVWIHGGGFVCGSSSTIFYSPDYIVEKDVIMVSMNYRLGIFGFLSLKDPKVGVPGNAGLKDQTMALKWIKENISVFGGDPTNITIAGESAGGASVHYHMISPLSKGLFNRAISLSGAAFNPWASASENYGPYLKKLVIALGLTGDADDQAIFDAISKTDPEKLIQLDSKLVDFNDIVLGTELMSIFVPQVEPYESEMCFLPTSPLYLGRDAWSKDMDVIFGGTANEGYLSYFFSPMDEQLELMHKNNELFLLPEIRKGLSTETSRAKGQILKQLYFKKSSDKMSDYAELSNERQFWHGIHRAIMQRQTGSGKGKTYLYHLCVEPSVDVPKFYEFGRKMCKIPHMKGTGHGEDLPLLFTTSLCDRFKPGHDNYEVHQAFLNFLMEFTKTGKVHNWTPLEPGETQNVQCMEIHRKQWQMKKLPNMEKLRVWDGLYDPKELL